MVFLDETDRALVAALQRAPRATFSTIASAIGSDASTLTRRYNRLVADRRLKVRAMLDWRLVSQVNPSIVWIRCTPGKSELVAESLRGVAEVQSIFVVTGDADVHAMVFPGSSENRRHLLARIIPSIEGVVEVSSQLILHAARRVGEWRVESALDEHLLISQLPQQEVRQARSRGFSDAEQGVIELLLEDGRLGTSRLAQSLQVGRSTAQRALQTVLSSADVDFRVDVEPSTLGLPLAAIIAVRCSPGKVEALLERIARHAATRFAAMVAGSASVVVHGSFRDESSLRRFLSEDLGRIPGVDSLDVSIALATVRRNWTDYDSEGRMLKTHRPVLNLGDGILLDTVNVMGTQAGS